MKKSIFIWKLSKGFLPSHSFPLHWDLIILIKWCIFNRKLTFLNWESLKNFKHLIKLVSSLINLIKLKREFLVTKSTKINFEREKFSTIWIMKVFNLKWKIMRLYEIDNSDQNIFAHVLEKISQYTWQVLAFDVQLTELLWCFAK